jgi:hypothetical protein
LSHEIIKKIYSRRGALAYIQKGSIKKSPFSAKGTVQN